MSKITKVSESDDQLQQSPELNNEQDVALFTDARDRTLEQLFISSLKEMYWSENHLIKCLPVLIDAAGDERLSQALQDHREETKLHAERLEQVFELVGRDIVAQKCAAMEGLAISGENMISTTASGSIARDTGIIMSCVKVENFETTCYNGMITLAQQLGLADAVELLQQNLQEEVEAGAKLLQLQQP